MTIDPTFRKIATNGITLNVAEAGPPEGPPVILLHGFPESWYGWRNQIGPLAEAGYRVSVPDQRGYGKSDKPAGIKAYALDTLADDLIGLVDATGHPRASIIGHDWGGIVAWHAITRDPSRFDRAVILNAPHPVAMSRELAGNRRQRLKSWYVYAFQLPWLPELMLRRSDFLSLVRGMEQSSRRGTFLPADFAIYKKGWSEPKALTSMIHWYRAGARIQPRPYVDPLVSVPTLLIWGAKDEFLGRGVARSSYAMGESARLEWLEEASHWVQHEEPERVNRLILDFLAEKPSA